jgi:hypothetical protein
MGGALLALFRINRDAVSLCLMNVCDSTDVAASREA